MINLHDVVRSLCSGQRLVLCVPTQEHARQLRVTLLDTFPQNAKLLIVSPHSLDQLHRSKEFCRLISLDETRSDAGVVSAFKKGLARIPQSGFVFIDAVEPLYSGQVVGPLHRVLRKSPQCVVWFISRDSLGNQQIAALKDAVDFFVDVNAIGAGLMAQFLVARGMYEPEYFLPRMLTIEEGRISFGAPYITALVSAPPAGGGGEPAAPSTINFLEQKYRQVFESNREGMILFNLATGEREANQRMCEILGYAPDEVRTLGLASVIPPTMLRALLREIVLLRRKGKGTYDTRVLRKSARTVDIRVHASRLANDLYVGIVHDVTEEKKANAQLQRRQEEFRALADTDPVPRAVFANRKLIARNPAFEKIFSWLSADALADLTLQQLLGRKNVSLTREIGALAESGGGAASFKARAAVATPSGTELSLDISAVPLFYGARKAVQCSFIDVTAETHSLRQHMDVEAMLKGLVEHSTEAISLEEGGSFVFVNKRFLDLFGFSTGEEVVGKPTSVLNAKKRRMKKVEESPRAEAGVPAGGRFLETVRRTDGTLVEVETERSLFVQSGKEFDVTYRRDVTARKTVEHDTARKMDALETLQDTSLALHRSLELHDLQKVAMSAAMEAGECESAVLLSVGGDGNSLEVLASENCSEAILAGCSQMTAIEGLTGYAVKTQEPVLLTLHQYPPYLPYRSLFASEQFQTIAVLPLTTGDRPLAILVLASRKEKVWDDGHRFLLSALAAELGVAFANALQYDEMRQKEALIRGAVETARDVLYRCSPSGTFIVVGSGITALVGYTPQEFTRSATLMRELVHPDDRVIHSQRISHQAQNIDEFTLEYRVLPRGKATYRWVRDSIRYERSESGEVLSIVGVLSDITTYKELQDGLAKSEQLKANILNSIQEGVVVFDNELRYIDWNKTMEQMTGLPRDAVVGRRVDEGIPVLASQDVVAILRRALSGEAVNAEETPFALPATEMERSFWSQYAPLQDVVGSIRGVVGIVTDVSKRRQLEQEVRESEETLRNVIDTMGDALMICDLQGRVWEVNREFSRLTGFARKEAQGIDFPYPWVLEEDMGKFVSWIAALREQNYLRDFDMTWKAKDGRLVALSMNTTLLRSALGEPVAMLNIARDISERRQLMLELERKVHENVELYAQVQAQVGRLTSLYELGKSLTGTLDALTLLDIVRTEVTKAIPAESFAYYVYSPDEHALIPIYETSDGRREYEKHGNRSKPLPVKPGSIFLEVVNEGTPFLGITPAEMTPCGCLLLVPMKSKETVVGVLSLTRATADAFSESHLRLFESIANLTEIALEKATLHDDTVNKAREIEERNKELDDFTYVVSHDLKEPLITIEGYSKILLKDYNAALDQDGKEYLETVVQSSSHMKNLIDDLLTLSRLGHVKEAAEVVSSGEVVMDVVHDIQFTLHERNALVEVTTELPEVRYNRTQLGIVFRNLIANAVKFNDKPQPKIEISARAEAQDYVFSVKDNGIGIEERYFERIFMIFQRLHRKEEFRGTGAGLTIVKKIVENHHGRIWVNSTLGEGSTFSFTIPR